MIDPDAYAALNRRGGPLPGVKPGLGWVVAQFLHLTRIAAAVRLLKRGKPCGCPMRESRWDRKFPLLTPMVPWHP